MLVSGLVLYPVDEEAIGGTQGEGTARQTRAGEMGERSSAPCLCPSASDHRLYPLEPADK